jgi:SAM-dependent methyltransferase
LQNFSEYDFIYCIDVLQHVEDDGELIKLFSQGLKNGGVLYLATPRERHTNRYFRRLGLKYKVKAHVREGYNEKKLGALLSNNGFTINRIRTTWGLIGEGCEELYMLSLLRLPLVSTGLICPFLTILSRLDMFFGNRNGYGLVAIAHKA